MGKQEDEENIQMEGEKQVGTDGKTDRYMGGGASVAVKLSGGSREETQTGGGAGGAHRTGCKSKR